jgi:hypothetical protein
VTENVSDTSYETVVFLEKPPTINTPATYKAYDNPNRIKTDLQGKPIIGNGLNQVIKGNVQEQKIFDQFNANGFGTLDQSQPMGQVFGR